MRESPNLATAGVKICRGFQVLGGRRGGDGSGTADAVPVRLAPGYD